MAGVSQLAGLLNGLANLGVGQVNQAGQKRDDLILPALNGYYDGDGRPAGTRVDKGSGNLPLARGQGATDISLIGPIASLGRQIVGFGENDTPCIIQKGDTQR